jgi:hypothetical protein
MLTVTLGAGYFQLAIAPRSPATLNGQLGVPDAWRPPSHPFDVRTRPLEAASLAVDTPDGVVLAAADGHGYRLVKTQSSDQVKLSPDGRWIAWHLPVSDERPGGAALQVVHLVDGQSIDVTPPGRWSKVTSFDWSPDSTHLIATGGQLLGGAVGYRPLLWRVDARTGGVSQLCDCGYGVRSTADGTLVQVPTRGTIEVSSAVPPGTVRLPPTSELETPLVNPEGTAYVRVADLARLEVTTKDGRTRLLKVIGVSGVTGSLAGVPTPSLVGWTAAGIWVLTERSLVLVDPETAGVRSLTRFPAAAHAVTVATAITAGSRIAVVHADPPEPTWYTPAAIGDAVSAALVFPIAFFVLVILPLLLLTPLGWWLLALSIAGAVGAAGVAVRRRRAGRR